jgi:coproporphyrinogen III oxidase-like Fe-S oxidoreductase
MSATRHGSAPPPSLRPVEGDGARHLYISGPGPRDMPGGDSPLEVEGRWRSALLKEAEMLAHGEWTLAPSLASIHVRGDGIHGGGYDGGELSPEALRRLLTGLSSALAPGGELALEIQGCLLTEEQLQAWFDAGVSRLNLAWPLADRLLSRGGLQLRDGLLRRLSSLKQESRQWGVDLEFGSSESQGERAEALLQELVENHAPTQVSLVEAEASGPADLVADQYLALAQLLMGLGYEPWELTSFSLPGHAPTHGRAVWLGEAYLGLGPGAHSFLGGVRRWNLTEPEAYFSRIRHGLDPSAGMERPDPVQRRLEMVWAGLRLTQGIPLTRLPPRASRLQEDWIREGWAQPDPDRLRLTLDGWLLLDTLTIQLVEAWDIDDDSGGCRSSENRS